MSTRAHIVIRDGNDSLILYRGHDGYPEDCGEDLKRVCQEEKWEDIEYLTAALIRLYPNDSYPTFAPAVGIHGDEDYFWTVDLRSKTIKYTYEYKNGAEDVIYHQETKK